MPSLVNFFDSIPDLRNGDANAFDVLHVAAGIPVPYYVLNFETVLPAAANIRTRVKVVAAIYQHKLAEAGLDDAKAKAIGMVIAAVREGMMKAWSLNAGNAIAAQTTVVTAAEWDGTEDALTDAIGIAGVIDRVNAYTEDYVSDSMISSLMRIGMGVFVTCGVILVRTEGMHHFVGENKVVSTAVGKQVFGADFTPPFGLTMDEFDDAAYHKSPHPWVSALMIAVARSKMTKVRLLAARLASAAVRIPAKYPAESGASAISNLVVKTEAAGRLANVAINVGAVTEACAAVTRGNMESAAERADAVTALAELIEDHASDIAICIGMFRAICNHANVGNPGLLRAKCLGRIAHDNPVMVSTGMQQMEAAIRVQREKSRRGVIPGIGLFGADAPRDTQALPADETMAQILAAVVGARPAAPQVP